MANRRYELKQARRALSNVRDRIARAHFLAKLGTKGFTPHGFGYVTHPDPELAEHYRRGFLLVARAIANLDLELKQA